VVPRAGLDAVARKISHRCTCRKLNPGRPGHHFMSLLSELNQLLEYYDSKVTFIVHFPAFVTSIAKRLYFTRIYGDAGFLMSASAL
jgi:hypothetical protein